MWGATFPPDGFTWQTAPILAMQTIEFTPWQYADPTGTLHITRPYWPPGRNFPDRIAFAYNHNRNQHEFYHWDCPECRTKYNCTAECMVCAHQLEEHTPPTDVELRKKGTRVRNDWILKTPPGIRSPQPHQWQDCAMSMALRTVRIDLSRRPEYDPCSRRPLVVHLHLKPAQSIRNH